MGEKWKPSLIEPGAARAFVVVSFTDKRRFEDIKKDLVSVFGAVDYESQTRYRPDYNAEEDIPGPNVNILSFKRPVGREELVDMERKCLGIQVRRQTDGKPDAIIWPGYVTDFVVIRAHTGDDFHRIYLYGGVYAEAILRFEKGSFRPFVHTHGFFKNDSIYVIFNDLRLIHLGNG